MWVPFDVDVQDFVVTDVNVTFNLTHPTVGDISLVLMAPSNLQQNLFPATSLSGANFVGTTLDDEGPTLLTSGTAPYTGSYIPGAGHSLNIFDDEEAGGTWTLYVFDSIQNNTGTLHDWTLTFEGYCPTTTPPSL